MTETLQAVDPPQTNGIDLMDDDERAKIRPADIDADVKEMERRKRVEHIMNSRMFREELERIIETQMNEGTGTNSLMQQISDMMGVNKQGGNFYKNSSCVLPINDIRGIEAMGYGKGEKILRCKLAAVYRLIDLCGWNQGTTSLITARLNQDEEHFLVNPYGMLYHEITASSLIKIDMQANIVEQGTTNFSVNISAFSLHGAIHAARPDIKCIIHLHTPSVVAISATKAGILPISQESVVIGEVSTHPFLGGLIDPEEKDKLARNLGPNNKILLLSNQGVLCCGETIEEAFFNARNTVLACEAQLKLLPIGLDNIILLNEETRKRIYEAAHKAPESTPRPDKPSILEGKVERKWRVGGIEFEGLMRMLDNVGFRTGYIYRHPLVKGDVPRPKNDVEVPPAVSSLGYLLEEEELYKKGLWRNLGEGKKGQNRSRWLNSPNVYQRVEFLETGTQDPKKITKWVADGSPTHSSTPVKIDNALQFVPKNTNPKEFKLKQQQIKDYRRADKISAGPQSYLLDTLTWEEAKKMQDASINQSGDQVVLMGAASKGIIQRGHQHNAMVYKSPYAKNPFDSVTDEELDEYKKVVEKKVKGDYDTDFSESEISSAAINKRMDSLHLRSPTSETEEESRDEPQVLRIETKQAPRPSQPEVVLSDATPNELFLRAERQSTHSNRSYRTLTRRDIFKSTYRTNSHFGLPKGSYLVPNPVHFHIVHTKRISEFKKPQLTRLTPYNCSSGYLFNHNRSRTNSEPLVTVKFDNSHSVSVNIPIEILRGFIMPFASALSVTSVPLLNTRSSQTTYMNNFEHKRPSSSELRNNYTPLTLDYESAIDDASTASFEAQILQKMQDKIMNLNTSMYSDATVVDNSNSSDHLKHFDENDEVESNESLVEAGCVELTKDQVEILDDDNEIVPTKDFTDNSSESTRNIQNMDENKEVKNSDSFDDSMFTEDQEVVSKGCTILTTVVDSTSNSSGISFNLKQFDENDEIMSIKIFDDQEKTPGYGIEISTTNIGTSSDNLNNFEENNKDKSNKSIDEQEEAAVKDIDILTIDIGILQDNLKSFVENEESKNNRKFEVQTEATSNDIKTITSDTDTSYRHSKQLEENDVFSGSQSCSKDDTLSIELMGEFKPTEDQEILNEYEKTYNTELLDEKIAIPMKENEELSVVSLMKNLPFGNIDDEMLIGLCKRRSPDDGMYHSIHLENKYQNNKEVNIDNDNRIENAINEVLEDIEGSINSLPVICRKVQNAGNRLSRISEATNEDPENELLEITYEVSCSSDIRNDTFIVDDVEDIKECANYTFTIHEIGDEEKEPEMSKQDVKDESLLNIPGEFDENKNIITSGINRGNVEEAQEETFSEDEGIGDVALDQTEKSPVKQIRFDEHVKTLAGAIYDYLQEQCFEIKELVLFPEILHDRNLNKLLARLKTMYDEFYSNKLDDEEKNELRMSISAAILGNLENDSKINAESSNDSSLLNIVSDKVFTITEFVSDILDSFFNLVSQSTCLVVKEDSNGENFLEFTKPFRDDNGNLLHSTPESAEIMETNNVPEKDPVTSPTDAVVTAFKKDTSRKSGAETFWISCNTSPQIRKGTPKTPKRVFNIDDIPLRPPEDLVFRSPENNLCSIPEEARCNLFGPSYDDECALGPRVPETHETVEVKLDDILAGGDGSYISLNEPEMNVVVHNEVTFYRICTPNKSPFLKANSVTFQKNKINSENDSSESFYSACGNLKEKEDDEGDWMGFDMAKF